MSKTWFVTGTSSGFGKALASLLAQKSDINLVATARKMNDLGYLDEFEGAQIEKVVMDVTDKEQVQAGVQQAVDRFGSIDVLVNNAGMGYFATIEESKEEDIRQIFEVNLFGLAKVTKAALPTLRAQKAGLIINISSVLGTTSLPTMGWYSATKFAVEGYSNALRQEVAPLGIKVMNVEPSGARTKWNASKAIPVGILDYSQFADGLNSAADGVTQAPGSPEAIAEMIFDVATGSDPVPAHLPLGQFATDGMKRELTGILSEVDKYHDTSVKADQ